MKNKAHDLTTYAFAKEEVLLFDTNVWLYLFPAPSNPAPAFTSKYSAGLKRMQQVGTSLALDALVLAEYLNAYCRIEWNALHKPKYPQFKKFRQSAQFIAVGAGAALFARNILKLCARHDHPFLKSDIEQVLADFEAGVSDFNDGLLIETCRMNGWKLVTNDGDCTNGGIELVTSNPKLIAACPR